MLLRAGTAVEHRTIGLGPILVRAVVATILLGAATLKALATSPTTSLTTRIVSCAIPSIEFCLAVWLLSGVHSALSWTLCGICFFVFAQFSLFNALAGQESCGCFGAFKVNPSLTCILDLVALAAVLRFHPGRLAAHSVPKIGIWSWRLAPLIAVVLACFIWSRTVTVQIKTSMPSESANYFLGGDASLSLRS